MLTRRLRWGLALALPVLMALFSVKSAAADELPGGIWWHDPRVIGQLKLNPAEIRQLDALFASFRGKLIDLKKDVQREQGQLDSLLTRKGMDERNVQKQFRNLEDGRTRLASERLRFTVEVRRIIGPQRFQDLKRSYRNFR